ncbi:MAG: hypothetical protein JW915_05265 [Chitinispirillaceae bacterium]|nr:hypothetical protein [Chitinispirillaceae bacterium]
MLLGHNEVPFPDNPHCKRCLSKNCRELLVQPLFPGKVIFVHRKRFCSIPDYVPSWRNQENGAPAQEAALTDDLEIVSGPVTVTNPRWERKEKENEGEQGEKVKGEVKVKVKGENTEEKVSFGDTIILMADVTGMPEGSGITFDIYEMSEDPPMCVATAKGKIASGIGKGEWVVTDKSGKGEESKLAFEGIAKSKASEKCEIRIVASEDECKFTLYVDPDDPESYDDKAILKGVNFDYEQIKTIADDKVKGDGLFTVRFTGLEKGRKYQLIHDDGQQRHLVLEEYYYGN